MIQDLQKAEATLAEMENKIAELEKVYNEAMEIIEQLKNQIK
jgi:hypothetical protein